MISKALGLRIVRQLLTYHSMSIIDDNHEFDRILESTILDECELIDLAMEQRTG